MLKKNLEIKFKLKKIFLILSICSFALIIFNFINVYHEGFKTRFHPFAYKYDNDYRDFELKYNYHNFSTKKNIFIIGNSYSVNLLNILSNNEKLEEKYYFYSALADDIGKGFQLHA